MKILNFINSFFGNLLLFFLALSMFLGCGDSSGANAYMTEKEFAIINNIKNYHNEGKRSRIQPPEALEWLNEFYAEVPDEETENDPKCQMLSVEELTELANTDEKSKYLRAKGFHLIGGPFRKIKSHKDIEEGDELTFGSCKTPMNNSGGYGLLGGLASTIPKIGDFRINIKVDNRENSAWFFVSFKESDKTYSWYNALKNNLKSIGEEKINKNPNYVREIFKHNERFWIFHDQNKEVKIMSLERGIDVGLD